MWIPLLPWSFFGRESFEWKAAAFLLSPDHRGLAWFHTSRNAFSQSKKNCHFFMKVSRMKVSRWIKWSTTPLFLRNPVSILLFGHLTQGTALLSVIDHLLYCFTEAASQCNGLIIQRIRSVFVCFEDGYNYHLSPCSWEGTIHPDIIKDILQALDEFIQLFFEKLIVYLIRANSSMVRFIHGIP